MATCLLNTRLPPTVVGGGASVPGPAAAARLACFPLIASILQQCKGQAGSRQLAR